MAVIPYYWLVCCGGLLAVAAMSDISQRRIPNVVVVALAASGLVARLVTLPLLSTAAALGASVLVLVVLIPVWSRRILGGGDVKLAVAATIWVGWQQVGVFAVATAIAGGVLAVGCGLALALRPAQPVMLPEGTASGALVRVARVRAGTVPYGAAIAVGAILAVVWG